MADPFAALGAADLQVHTSRSDGLTTPEEAVRWAERAGLDVLAITDHDDLRGALETREVAARIGSRVEVVTGIEITTRSGHLLALFIERPVPSFRSLAATLEAVHSQSGLCVIPHPLMPLPPSLHRRTIDRILTAPPPQGAFDAIELAGGVRMGEFLRRRARRLNAERWHLPETGGSDAHFPEAIGRAVTRFPGHTAADLRRALIAGATVAEWRTGPSLREIGLRRLAKQQARALIATPRAVLWRSLRERLAAAERRRR